MHTMNMCTQSHISEKRDSIVLSPTKVERVSTMISEVLSCVSLSQTHFKVSSVLLLVGESQKQSWPASRDRTDMSKLDELIVPVTS